MTPGTSPNNMLTACKVGFSLDQTSSTKPRQAKPGLGPDLDSQHREESPTRQLINFFLPDFYHILFIFFLFIYKAHALDWLWFLIAKNLELLWRSFPKKYRITIESGNIVGSELMLVPWNYDIFWVIRNAFNWRLCRPPFLTLTSRSRTFSLALSVSLSLSLCLWTCSTCT